MIIPALDLSNGQVIRLKQGDFNQVTTFDVDPLTRIKTAFDEGAKLIHIVDLDGAKDPKKRQLDVIKRIVQKSSLPIQTGGGIRTYDDVKNLLDIGVERVVVGSVATNNINEVKSWFDAFGKEHITLAFDVRINDKNIAMVATHGWLNSSDKSINDLIDIYLDKGLEHVLVTDISKDGMMQGANNNLYKSLSLSYENLDIIASGGISSLDDIALVKKAGAKSVVLGRSLLENKFTVKEAIACWQNA